MDKWFVDLFDIISGQKKTTKMDLLLPELYNEFDILARNDNIEELSEIYQYINDDNPFKTINVEYNNKANVFCKKEVIKRLIILNDYSILDDEFSEILSKNNKKIINDYLEVWRDNIIVTMHLKDIKEQFVPVQKKKPIKVKKSTLDNLPEVNEFPDMKVTKDLKEESIKEVIIKDEEITQVEAPIKIDPIIEDKIVEPKVLIKKEIKTETKVKDTPKKVVSVKPVIIEEIKKQPPVKKTMEDSEPKSVIKPKKNSEKTEKEILLGFVDMAIYKYKISINKEIIKKQTNPKRIIFGVMKDFVDEKERTTTFFVELFQLLIEYNLDSLISHIAEKSVMLKKLCVLNIGLLNETDLSNIFSLLDTLRNEDIIYIKESISEREIRTYIDNHKSDDYKTEDLITFSNLASMKAPKQMETHEAIKAIDYFTNSIFYNKTKALYEDNIDVLYWSMILSAVLGIYVSRKNVSNYIDSMNITSKIAIKLLNKIDKSSLKSKIQNLTISYIRRIYKSGTSSHNYDNWWQKQKDDLLDAKLNALDILRPID